MVYQYTIKQYRKPTIPQPFLALMEDIESLPILAL